MAEDKAVPHLYVALRVRPLLAHEREGGDEAAVTVVPSSSAPQQQPHDALASCNASRTVVGGPNYVARVLQPSSITTTTSSSQTTQRVRDFALDCVFGPAATQENIFRTLDLAALCEDAFRGVAGTVFCFGQTGSGKTYTMSGQAATAASDGQHESDSHDTRNTLMASQPHDEAEEGVQSRAVRYVAELLAQKRQSMAQVTVKASYLELYNERLNDLLQPGCPHPLRCRWSASAQCFYVENALLVQCESAADLRLVLQEGAANRQRGSHLLNADSSRSHVLFVLYIETRLTAEAPPRYGKLTFVDLAGSERLKETGSSGEDTKAINRSLFLLGTVIERLAARQQQQRQQGADGKTKKKENESRSLQRRRQRAGVPLSLVDNTTSDSRSEAAASRTEGDSEDYIPYRSSVLTQLLMDSLSGNCRTVMIACVSPARRFVEESLRTMHYAQRARHIVAAPVQRVDWALQEKYLLQQQVQQLQEENRLLRQALQLPLEASSEAVRQLLQERHATPAHPAQHQQQQQTTTSTKSSNATEEPAAKPQRAKAAARTKATAQQQQPAALFTRARLTPLRLRPPAPQPVTTSEEQQTSSTSTTTTTPLVQAETRQDETLGTNKTGVSQVTRRQLYNAPLPAPPAQAKSFMNNTPALIPHATPTPTTPIPSMQRNTETSTVVPGTASSCPVTRHAMPRRVAGSVDTHVQRSANAQVSTPHALSFSSMPSRPSPQSALELLQQLPDSSALPHKPQRRM